MAQVKRFVIGRYVHIVVEDRINERGQFTANLLLELLGIPTPHKTGNPYLIASSILKKMNVVTVGAFINDSLMFYKGERFSDRVLLLVTDAAPYMIS